MAVGTGVGLGLQNLLGWQVYIGGVFIVVGIYGLEHMKLLKQIKNVPSKRVKWVGGISLAFIVIGFFMIITKFF